VSKGGETRSRIVKQAAALFNQNGFEGSSMADLMEAAGLEKGGLYRHFSNKQQIAVEAFDYAWQSAKETRTHDLETIANSVDKLKQFIANFVDRRPSVPGGCPILNTAIDSDDGNPALRNRALKALEQWLDLLGTIIKGGIAAGEIRDEVDPSELAVTIISSLEGALMMRRLQRDKDAMRAVQLHLEKYLESEIRRRSSKTRSR
jgi:TetR/AcrR family transcriptional repressor of nem operon